MNGHHHLQSRSNRSHSSHLKRKQSLRNSFETLALIRFFIILSFLNIQNHIEKVKVDDGAADGDLEDNDQPTGNSNGTANSYAFPTYARCRSCSRSRSSAARRRRRTPRWRPPTSTGTESGYESNNRLKPGRIIDFFKPATPNKNKINPI